MTHELKVTRADGEPISDAQIVKLQLFITKFLEGDFIVQVGGDGPVKHIETDDTSSVSVGGDGPVKT